MSWTPTEKDVYGQEPDPSWADSMAKYHPESVYMEFNPHDFAKHWTKQKPKSNKMKTHIKNLAIGIPSILLLIGILTLVVKVVVTEVVLIWNLW